MVKKKKKRGFYDPNNVMKLLETQPKDLDRSQKKEFWSNMFSRKTIKQWYTTEEVASISGYTVRTINRMAKEGQLRSHSVRNKKVKRYYHEELAEDFFKLDVQIYEHILLDNKNKKKEKNLI